MNPLVIKIAIPLIGGLSMAVFAIAKILLTREAIHHDNSSERDVCNICLEDLNKSKSNRTLSCGHKFHTICIQKIFEFEVERTCPICRKKA